MILEFRKAEAGSLRCAGSLHTQTQQQTVLSLATLAAVQASLSGRTNKNGREDPGREGICSLFARSRSW